MGALRVLRHTDGEEAADDGSAGAEIRQEADLDAYESVVAPLVGSGKLLGTIDTFSTV
jgi:hypothetical protein